MLINVQSINHVYFKRNFVSLLATIRTHFIKLDCINKINFGCVLARQLFSDPVYRVLTNVIRMINSEVIVKLQLNVSLLLHK